MSRHFRIIIFFMLTFSCISMPLSGMSDGDDVSTTSSSFWDFIITQNKKIVMGTLALGIGGFLVYTMYKNSQPCTHPAHKQPDEKNSTHSVSCELQDQNRIILSDELAPDVIQRKSTNDVPYKVVQCRVAWQSGATCAYHALLNGLYMAMVPFVKNGDSVVLENIMHALVCKHDIRRLIGSSGVWRTTAKKYISEKKRALPKNAEWLDKEAIEDALLDYERKNQNLLHSYPLTHKNITIIDDIASIATSIYDEQFLLLCQRYA